MRRLSLAAVLVSLALAGCASGYLPGSYPTRGSGTNAPARRGTDDGASNTGKGAVIGATAGAVLGAIIGENTGSTARGAIIGAAVGGVAGAIVGREMDVKAEQFERELHGAKIERVGEGILVTFGDGVLFDFDSSALRPEARESLRRLVAAIDPAEVQLMIVGHTDSKGSEEYNRELSIRRAQSAVDYLSTLGFPRHQMSMRGMGEAEPVATNETEAGRQANRRVEIAVFASPEYREKLVGSVSE